MSEIIDTYKTLQSRSEGLYKEKGSKFIAIALPVTTEEEIKIEIENIRKEYYDARHHCYAWTLGADRKRFRSNDDGEPSNSAGKPILGRLDSHGLTQLLIVVVRYFGGVKLGVGGLIVAYRSAAEDAISNGKIITRKMKMHFQLNFQYASMNEIMQLIKNSNLDQLEHDFGLDCKIKLACPEGDFQVMKSVFLGIDNVKIKELFVV